MPRIVSLILLYAILCNTQQVTAQSSCARPGRPGVEFSTSYNPLLGTRLHAGFIGNYKRFSLGAGPTLGLGGPALTLPGVRISTPLGAYINLEMAVTNPDKNVAMTLSVFSDYVYQTISITNVFTTSTESMELKTHLFYITAGPGFRAKVYKNLHFRLGIFAPVYLLANIKTNLQSGGVASEQSQTTSMFGLALAKDGLLLARLGLSLSF
jgi:hypothetical protein